MRMRKSAKNSIFSQENNCDDITTLNLVPTPTILAPPARPSGAHGVAIKVIHLTELST